MGTAIVILQSESFGQKLAVKYLPDIDAAFLGLKDSHLLERTQVILLGVIQKRLVVELNRRRIVNMLEIEVGRFDSTEDMMSFL